MVNQSENQNLITDGVNEQTPSRKQPTIVHETPFHEPFPPKYNKNSSSPVGIFSKLFGSTPVQGSPSHNSNANSSLHYVSPIFSKKKNKQRISTPENYKNKVQKQPQKNHIFVINEITFLKQPFQREQDSVLSENPNQTEVLELTKAGEGQMGREICMKSKDSTNKEITRTKDQNLVGKSETEIHTKMKSSENSDCPFTDEIVDLQKCQSQLNSRKKENTDLQVRFKDFVSQSKQLRMENEKLIREL